MTRIAAVIAVSTLATAARGKLVEQTVKYEHNGVTFAGLLVYDDTRSGPRPGVFVVHEWWGLNEFAKTQARRLAELGYVAFAADLYGEGRVTSDPAEAGKLAGEVRGDAELWMGRAKAALDAFAKSEHVDPKRIAGIGFCFGGTTVLQMAGAGHELAAVVSFHGNLPPFSQEQAERIRAKVLVLHGAADTHVPDQAVTAFMDSLRETKVDWQLVAYSGAKHSFMNPDSDKMKSPGVGYDERTAKRAWAQMQAFFKEVL